MRKIITGLLIVMLSTVTSQAVYAESVGKFVKVEGRVDVTRPGEPAEQVNVGTEIFEKDIIRSKSDSKAEILFVDGNVLRLAQKTRVEISEYISDSNRRSTILNLFRGKIQNKVKKLFGGIFGNDENRYEVHTPTSVCGVRGTNFFMSYQRGISQATFKEGFGYGYNRNQPDRMIEVQAGQSMVISGVNTPPAVKIAPPGEINRLEEETTPVKEKDGNADEAGGSGEIDNSIGKEKSIAEEGSDEKESTVNDSEPAGGDTRESNGSDDSQPVEDSSIMLADASGTEMQSETVSGDDDFTGLISDENNMDSLPADDQPENTNQLLDPATQTDPVILDSDPPEVLPQDIDNSTCPDPDNCDNTDSTIADILSPPPDTDVTEPAVDPTPADPEPTDPVPADPTPTDPITTDPVTDLPTAPIPAMALSGKLMAVVPGRHYEGEYILPRSTDPYRTEYMGRIEAATYHYDYFLADDGTYLRGFAEEETSDPMTWTMYDYLPDGILFTETGSEGDINPQTTESTWTQTDIESIATPPAGYYERHANDFTASMITGIGSFTGEIQVPSELWIATQSTPLDIALSGQYISSGDPLSLVKSPLSGSFTDGGAYSGFLSGNAESTNGFINVLYINPEGTELGVLKGDFSGAFNTTGDWSAAGTMYPAVFSTDPGTVTNDNFLTGIDNSGYLEIERLTGDFSGGSGVSIKAYGFGNTSFIKGNDWGIFDLVFGYGDYDETAVSDTWSGSITGFGMFGENGDGMWKADITGGSWLTDGVNGDLNGRFLTMTAAGIIEGRLIGPAGSVGSWTGVSQGTWQKTDDLQFSSRFDGGLYTIQSEEGGNYWMSANESWYSYHYDLESHEGGYQFYDSANDTDTYMQINAWDFDGTAADFNREEWVYNHTSLAFVNYSSNRETMFDLATLADAASYTGLTWDYSETWTNYNMFETGWFEGILGGLDSPWAATSTNPGNITLLGFYEIPFYITPGQPIIFSNDTESFNPADGSSTTFDGGAYAGFTGGILTSSADGNICAIYISPDNNAGVLFGEFHGTAYSISGIWEASGGVYPVQLYSSLSITPDNLVNNVKYTEYHFWGDSYATAGDDGYFFDGSGAETGYFDVGGGHYFSKNITGESWGVWQNVVGGAYTGTPASDWTMNIHHEMWDEFNNVTGMIAKYGVSGGTWSGDKIDADVLGAWVDLEDVVVGISSGKLAGTYDPADMTWQTYGSGVWIKTGQFIDMTTTSEGRATLAELNIPAVEIGRTTLSGTGSTISVTMTDVTFFAPVTGEAPRIWATDNIGGTYSATPYIGDYVYLSDESGTIGADFTLKKWDNNGWAADISNGNGTLKRTDVAGTANVDFNGVAAGTYSGTASGTFSGEGAGVVR